MKTLLILIAIMALSNCTDAVDYRLIKVVVTFHNNSTDTIMVREAFGINSNGALFEYPNRNYNPRIIATDVKYVKRLEK